jgi:outer membrane protein assembly factor BamD
VEMYERIIKNAPYGTYAPQCQFKIGLARESQRRFTDAVDSYQKVLDNYPTSSEASSAQYQIGYAWMHASQTGDYDMGAAKKAIEAFQDYLVRYPDSDKADQATQNIEHLSHKQTQGAFDIAQFYEREHPPERRAAFIYYNEVVREDPNSAQAQLAKKRIQELRPLVEAMPGGAGPDGVPQTVASGPQATNGAPVDPAAPANSSLPDTSTNSALPDTSTNSALPDTMTNSMVPNAPAAPDSTTNTPISTVPDSSSMPGGTPTPAPSSDQPASTPPAATPLPQ